MSNKEVVLNSDKKIHLRENTLDKYIFNEIFKNKVYKKLTLKSDDVVFDIGANVGFFALYASKDVKKVICFEPDKENFSLLEENTSSLDNIILENKAVIGGHEKTRTFYLNTKKNKGAHSLYVKRGRQEVTVDCSNINSLLQKYSPNKVKMDIEGGEREVIYAIKEWSNIDELIFEYHHNVKGQSHKDFYALIKYLKQIFEFIDYIHPKKHWTSIVYCKKDKNSLEEWL